MSLGNRSSVDSMKVANRAKISKRFNLKSTLENHKQKLKVNYLESYNTKQKIKFKSLDEKVDLLSRNVARVVVMQQEILSREKLISNQEKQISSTEVEIKKHEEKIERALFSVAGFTVRKKHLLELIRGVAGSFLGVGLGRNLLNMETLAAHLGWINIVGILVFILVISGLLIYKNERKNVTSKGIKVVFSKLFFLYVCSLVVEFLALWLFSALPSEVGLMVKVLVIGSFAAMAGAVSFSLI